MSEARQIAVKSICKAQKRYKAQYKQAPPSKLRVGDWVSVYFPAEDMGRMRKLSRPWYGPFRICSMSGCDVTVTRVYSPSNPIQIQLNHVLPSPPQLPAGFYWYGPKCKSPDHPPRWVEQLLSTELLSAGMSREPQDHGVNVDLHGNTSATPGHADGAGGGSGTTGELQTAAPSGERDTDVQEDESHQEGTSTPHAGDDGSNVITTCTTATELKRSGTSI